MTTYVFRRLLLMVPTLLGITLITFVIVQMVPGGPIEQMMARMVMMGEGGPVGGGQKQYKLTEDEINVLKEFYGFDQPIPVRYWRWLKNIGQLNLGDSYRYSTPVLEIIVEKLPVSAYFGLVTTILTYLICIPLGIFKAIRHQSLFDNASSFLIFAGYAIPAFAFGMLLLVLFSANLGWFPLGEFVSDNFEELSFPGKVADLIHHTALPLFAYLIGSFAFMTMLMKNSIMENMSADYVKTALAKGVSYNRAIFYHAFRNGLIPLATSFGNNISIFLMGSFLIEKIFNIDGLGLLGYTSIVERDYPVVMGMLVISSVLLLVGNLLSDLCVAAVDPRVRFQ